ncbi:unnamed protein product, partial [Symbiodinium sp. KB8]
VSAYAMVPVNGSDTLVECAGKEVLGRLQELDVNALVHLLKGFMMVPTNNPMQVIKVLAEGIAAQLDRVRTQEMQSLGRLLNRGAAPAHQRELDRDEIRARLLSLASSQAPAVTSQAQPQVLPQTLSQNVHQNLVQHLPAQCLSMTSAAAQAFQQATNPQPPQMLGVFNSSGVDIFAQDPGPIGPIGPRAVGPVSLDNPVTISVRQSVEARDFGLRQDPGPIGPRAVGPASLDNLVSISVRPSVEARDFELRQASVATSLPANLTGLANSLTSVAAGADLPQAPPLPADVASGMNSQQASMMANMMQQDIFPQARRQQLSSIRYGSKNLNRPTLQEGHPLCPISESSMMAALTADRHKIENRISMMENAAPSQPPEDGHAGLRMDASTGVGLMPLMPDQACAQQPMMGMATGMACNSLAANYPGGYETAMSLMHGPQDSDDEDDDVNCDGTSQECAVQPLRGMALNPLLNVQLLPCSREQVRCRRDFCFLMGRPASVMAMASGDPRSALAPVAVFRHARAKQEYRLQSSIQLLYSLRNKRAEDDGTPTDAVMAPTAMASQLGKLLAARPAVLLHTFKQRGAVSRETLCASPRFVTMELGWLKAAKMSASTAHRDEVVEAAIGALNDFAAMLLKSGISKQQHRSILAIAWETARSGDALLGLEEHAAAALTTEETALCEIGSICIAGAIEAAVAGVPHFQTKSRSPGVRPWEWIRWRVDACARAASATGLDPNRCEALRNIGAALLEPCRLEFERVEKQHVEALRLHQQQQQQLAEEAARKAEQHAAEMQQKLQRVEELKKLDSQDPELQAAADLELEELQHQLDSGLSPPSLSVAERTGSSAPMEPASVATPKSGTAGGQPGAGPCGADKAASSSQGSVGEGDQ